MLNTEGEDTVFCLLLKRSLIRSVPWQKDRERWICASKAERVFVGRRISKCKQTQAWSELTNNVGYSVNLPFIIRMCFPHFVSKLNMILLSSLSLSFSLDDKETADILTKFCIGARFCRVRDHKTVVVTEKPLREACGLLSPLLIPVPGPQPGLYWYLHLWKWRPFLIWIQRQLTTRFSEPQ